MTPAQIQSVRNLALLARQALGNQYETMSVDPRMVAEAAIALEGLLPLLHKAGETIQWMSGSPDFAPGGTAHEGWVKARPVLDTILAMFPKPTPSVS